MGEGSGGEEASQERAQEERDAEDFEFRERKQAINQKSRRKHRDAINVRRRKRYATDPDLRVKTRASNSSPKRRDGSREKVRNSIEEYDARLTAQGGVCPICLKPSNKVLCVDHDHETRNFAISSATSAIEGLAISARTWPPCDGPPTIVDYWQRCHAKPNDARPPPFAGGVPPTFRPKFPVDPIPTTNRRRHDTDRRHHRRKQRGGAPQGAPRRTVGERPSWSRRLASPRWRYSCPEFTFR